MPSVKLSPLFNDEQLDNNGLPLSGGKLYWYIAGTTTPISVYQESSGTTPHTQPIVLNTRGEVPAPIWMATGGTYKAVLQDSLGNAIRTIDNISGINDVTTPVIQEWVLYAGSATYISGTSFSVVGDATATFTALRRIKATVSGGVNYSTINTSVFAAGITTITVVNDAIVLDSGLSTVYYGFLDPSHPSFDSSGINAATKSAFQNQTFTAFTTGGASGAFTLTPSPALTSLAANQRFRIKFHAGGNGTDTLAVSGLAAKALKQYDQYGIKANPNVFINQLTDVEYDGTDWVIFDRIINPVMPGTIISFGGSAAPTGYLACPTATGGAQVVSRTTYAALFAAVGVLWGAGDGSTTFGIPWFPVDYPAVQGGTVGSSTTGTMPSHVHTLASAALAAGGGATWGSNTSTTNTPSSISGDNLTAGVRVLHCVKF